MAVLISSRVWVLLIPLCYLTVEKESSPYRNNSRAGVPIRSVGDSQSLFQVPLRPPPPNIVATMTTMTIAAKQKQKSPKKDPASVIKARILLIAVAYPVRLGTMSAPITVFC